jgi:hypothetical protein
MLKLSARRLVCIAAEVKLALTTELILYDGFGPVFTIHKSSSRCRVPTSSLGVGELAQRHATSNPVLCRIFHQL